MNHTKNEESVIIDKDVHSVYEIWTNVEKFPKFMKNITTVEKRKTNLMHWVAEGPFDIQIEWDTRIEDQEEDRKISWASAGGDIIAEGEVEFNPVNEHRTRVSLWLDYESNKGVAASIFQSMFGHPENHIEYSLKKFKEYAERN
jgi:uncharacterized membrane protein